MLHVVIWTLAVAHSEASTSAFGSNPPPATILLRTIR